MKAGIGFLERMVRRKEIYIVVRVIKTRDDTELSRRWSSIFIFLC